MENLQSYLIEQNPNTDLENAQLEFSDFKNSLFHLVDNQPNLNVKVYNSED